MTITLKAQAKIRELGPCFNGWSTLPLTHTEAMQALDEFVIGKYLPAYSDIDSLVDARIARDRGQPWEALLGTKFHGLRLVPVEGESLSLASN